MTTNKAAGRREGDTVTKKELKMYKVYKLEIRSIEDSILELQTVLENVSSKPITDEQTNHNAFIVDKQSDLVLKKLELEDKLMIARANLIESHEQIEGAIEKLNEPIERTVLRMRYINDMKWEEICVHIDYEWAQMHRIHNKALKNMSRIET